MASPTNRKESVVMETIQKYVILDTETANSLEEPLAYDIGFAVIDELGNVYEAHSFAVAEIFLDKNLMSSAYYAEKIPAYWNEIQSGQRKLCRLDTISRIFRNVCKQHNVSAIIAHNARFDNRSTNLTKRFITCSKYRYFMPYGVEIWDTLKMAREVFKADEEYNSFCTENDFRTKNSQCRFTAEILYRFLSGDVDFIEAHTGLADVMIEKEIFVECMRRGCEKRRLWGD